MSKASELYGQPWSEREYIIVLYYYFEHKNEPRYVDSKFVQEAAELLGRTKASVVMRMENFSGLDPEVGVKRKGLIHDNPFCRRMFHRWSNKLDALRACAEAFIRDTRAVELPTLFEPEPVQMPKVFGKYELFDQIGEGSFGRVFSCVNMQNEQPYAIKFIRLDVIHDDECLHRFIREIKALKAIEHPNIIKIYEDNLETERNYPVFVMDLASNNLEEYLTDKAKLSPKVRPVLPMEERCHILRCILDAVETLHTGKQSLIHRDINPNNVLLGPENNWMLADFSLAKFIMPTHTSTAFSTNSQQAWGTVGYAAPEQFNDFRNTDERADIYALGRLIWDLFTKLPPPPRPEKELHGLPEILAPLYLKAIAYEREERYSSVKQLRSDFEEAVAHITSNNG